MSFLAGLAPRLASMAFQPAVLAAGVATGVAVGAVGVGTGTIPVTDAGPRLIALYECPDSARVVKNLPSNQNVLVTARSADGAWLQIYIGEASVERGWARAASLELKAAPDSLPIADCTPTATTVPTFGETLGPPSSSSPGTSTAPSAAPTGVPATTKPSTGASATPAPTKTPKPTPTHTPAPTPFQGPLLSDFAIAYGHMDSGTGHWFIWRPGVACSDLSQTTFSVVAKDPDGVVSGKLYYRTHDGTTGTFDMYLEDAPTDTWQADLFSSGAWDYGQIEYWIQMSDAFGNKSALTYPSNAYYLELVAC